MKLIATMLAAFVLVSAAPVPATGTGEGAAPRQIVRNITDQVLAILTDDGLSRDEKRSRIETIVYDHVDFETMSRLILARNWKKLDEGQQKEFVAEFRRHLSLTYGKNVDSYRDEKVTITGDRKEARKDWTVMTRIVRNGPNDIFVDYRLRETDDGWRIIDVVIERVSLVSNFRSQFQEILTNGGPERLLRLLREKNESGESGLQS